MEKDIEQLKYKLNRIEKAKKYREISGTAFKDSAGKGNSRRKFKERK